MKIRIFNFIKYLHNENILTNKLILFGKTNYDYSFLKVIIMWILCNGKKKSIPCRKCLSCIFFIKKKHPDFFEIFLNNSLSISIDDIITSENRYISTCEISRKKIVLIYLIDDMNENALNSIFKVIENIFKNTMILFFANKKINDVLIKKLFIINIFRYNYNYNYLYSINLINYLYNISNLKQSINIKRFLYLIKNENINLISNTLNIFFYKLTKYKYLNNFIENKKINNFIKNDNFKLIKKILYKNKINYNINYLIRYIISIFYRHIN